MKRALARPLDRPPRASSRGCAEVVRDVTRIRAIRCSYVPVFVLPTECWAGEGPPGVAHETAPSGVRRTHKAPGSASIPHLWPCRGANPSTYGRTRPRREHRGRAFASRWRLRWRGGSTHSRRGTSPTGAPAVGIRALGRVRARGLARAARAARRRLVARALLPRMERGEHRAGECRRRGRRRNRSPLVFIFFLPVAFAALSYPPAAVVAVAAAEYLAYLAVELLWSGEGAAQLGWMGLALASSPACASGRRGRTTAAAMRSPACPAPTR